MERINFFRGYSRTFPSSSSTRIESDAQPVITPLAFATTTAPESRAAIYSIPVPTRGASVRSSGTACLCILHPIRARLASSCSRNGTRLAAILTSCFGQTSIYPTRSGETLGKPSPNLERILSSRKRPFPSRRAFACAITCSSSISAERYSTSSLTLPFTTFLYGVSRKPNLFIRTYVERETIRPMFGPSGVSIGQIRP